MLRCLTSTVSCKSLHEGVACMDSHAGYKGETNKGEGSGRWLVPLVLLQCRVCPPVRRFWRHTPPPAWRPPAWPCCCSSSTPANSSSGSGRRMRRSEDVWLHVSSPPFPTHTHTLNQRVSIHSACFGCGRLPCVTTCVSTRSPACTPTCVNNTPPPPHTCATRLATVLTEGSWPSSPVSCSAK